MKRTLALLLCAAALCAEGGLDGKITRGKAKKLVEEAAPLVKQADHLYRSYVLGEIAQKDLLPKLKRMVKLYTRAADLLQAALDIQEDSGVIGQQRILCRRLAKLRAQVFFRRPKRAPPKPKPAPPDAPEGRPRPAPAPEPRTPLPRPKPRREPEPDPPRPVFEPDAPPGQPVDADLPILPTPEGDEEYEALVKADHTAISKMLSAYFGARKANKLHFRHRLCRGKGCQECGRTGRQINLYHFRKAFWNVYSPSLRASLGALDSLKAFHARAHQELSLLGPVVKSFRVTNIDYHGYWAKVQLVENSKAGKQKRTFTVISAGAGWYFYTPDTDQELIPREG